MDIMSSPDISEVQSRRYAEDVLLGRAALKGNTADGSYHLEIYGPGEEQKLPSCQNIWKEIEKRKQAEKKLEKIGYISVVIFDCRLKQRKEKL